MVSFLGRTDIREVRCRDTPTDKPNHSTLAAHARRGLTMKSTTVQTLGELRMHGTVRDSQFIIADSTGYAYWSNVPSNSSSKQNITEEMLVAYVEYLIDNIL